MNRKRSDLQLLKAIRDSEADDDVHEVIADVRGRARRVYPGQRRRPRRDRRRRRGPRQGEMLAKHERNAPVHARLDAFRALAAEQRARPREKLSRRDLLDRLGAARKDPRFDAPVAALFRDKSPEASTDDELWALLDQIELLAKLERTSENFGRACRRSSPCSHARSPKRASSSTSAASAARATSTSRSSPRATARWSTTGGS